MRPGARLGVDAGAVRIGVAVSDPGGVLASPLETVAAGRGDVDRIAELAADHDVVEVVVGLPRSLSGAEGAAADAARALAGRIVVALAARAGAEPVPVRLVDERLSTVTATSQLRGAGVRGRGQRAVVDQAAAVVILQSALDLERTSGRPPGEAVEVGA